MSIIADALKKAQRKGKSAGDAPPPFKLGQDGQTAHAAQPGQAPKAKPVVVQPGAAAPKAQPAPQAQPAAEKQAAPKAQKTAKKTKAKTSAKKSQPMNRKKRMLIMVSSIMVIATAVLAYVYLVYLPGITQGGISSSAPPPPPVQTNLPAQTGQQTAAVPGEAQAQAVDENVEVPPVPVMDSAAVNEASDSSGMAAADLPAYSGDASDSTGGAMAGFDGYLPDGNVGAPGAPAVPGQSGTIVHKGDKGKELREDIYHFNMAVYFQRKGDVREALREYDEVTRISPHNAEVFSNMGVLYNQVGEHEEAVSVLQKALLIDPRYSKARNNLAVAYYKMGQYELALEQANMAIEISPGNIDALSNMGLIYRKLGRTDQAEQSFSRALAVDPAYSAAHYNLALLYEQTGQLQLAARHYRSFLAAGDGSEELNSKVRARLRELTETSVPSGN